VAFKLAFVDISVIVLDFAGRKSNLQAGNVDIQEPDICQQELMNDLWTESAVDLSGIRLYSILQQGDRLYWKMWKGRIGEGPRKLQFATLKCIGLRGFWAIG